MSEEQLPFFATHIPSEVDLETSPEDSLQTPEWILGLVGLEGIGSTKALRIIQHFKTIQRLLNASSDEIQNVLGKTNFDLKKLVRKDASQPDDVKLLTYFDPKYPNGLRDLSDPPLLLWYRGVIPDNKSLAIVGTRNADEWGKKTTRVLAKICGENGFAVVSGLALGVDTEAHLGCLETSLPTIAILACDVRNPTPKSNLNLAEKIIEQGGCLVAEVPPGSETESFALVARNRLQAAWSQGLLVTQCGIPSGTLHTVRFAMEIGRPVVVLRPPTESKGEQYAGNWNLTDEGRFDSKILGGTKKFQDRIHERKFGADVVINSKSEFEVFLKNV
jgi:DNA processing protein